VTSPRWTFAGALALAGLLTAAAYSNALSGEFQLDDDSAVVENEAIRDLGALLSGRLLEVGRPVTAVTFALDHAVAGLDVRAYHRTSLLLHLATAALVALLARRLLRRLAWPGPDGLALFVAGLFALHPVQSQAVSYVAQRSEVLASLCLLLSLWLLLSAEEARPWSRASLARLGGALLAAGLALGAKSIAVTVPAAYLLTSALFPAPAPAPGVGSGAGGPVTWRTRLALAAPMTLLAGLAGARELASLGAAVGAGFDLPSLGPARYALTELAVMVRYLELLVWPTGQNLDYAFPLAAWPLEARTLRSGLLLLALSVAAGALLRWSFREPATTSRRAARLAGFGVAWFFLLLAPTSTVVPLADVIEEHRVYLASFGILLALGAGAGLALERLGGPASRWRQAAPILGLATWLAAGLALHQRNEVWTTRLSMWRDVVAKSPGKARAHENLGHALHLAGDPRGAALAYSTALRYAADGSVPYAKLVANVGASLLEFGRIPEAVRLLSQGLERAPDDPRLLGNLAVAHLQAGNLDAAETTARRAAARWPGDAGARQALALVLDRRGDRPAQACAAWGSYLAIRPGPEGEALARGRLASLGCGAR